MQIGVAGLGKMGSAIGARLIEMGHALTVWNRTSGKAQAHEVVHDVPVMPLPPGNGIGGVEGRGDCQWPRRILAVHVHRNRSAAI